MVTSEAAPDWLGPKVSFADPTLSKKLRDARVVFYPGAGNDLHALEIFGSSGAAHCFINVDYDAVDRNIFRNIPGYSIVSTESIDFATLSRALDLAVVHPYEHLWQKFKSWPDIKEGQSNLILLKRESAKRVEYFFILQAFVEAVWFYNEFWAKHGRGAYAILLQDHGFGLNWTQFGGPESHLYEMAQRGTLPDYLVVAENTEVWPGYERDRSIGPGGSAMHMRALFRRGQPP